MLYRSSRAILAGDYTHVVPYNPKPYGMSAAIASGKRATLAARQLLASGEAAVALPE